MSEEADSATPQLHEDDDSSQCSSFISKASSHTFSDSGSAESTASRALQFQFPWTDTIPRGKRYVSSCGCSFSDESDANGGGGCNESDDGSDDDYFPPPSNSASRRSTRASFHHCKEYISLFKRGSLIPGQALPKSKSIEGLFIATSNLSLAQKSAATAPRRFSQFGEGVSEPIAPIKARPGGVKRIFAVWKDSGFFVRLANLMKGK